MCFGVLAVLILGFVLVYASVLVSASGLYSSLGHGVVSKRRDVYVCKLEDYFHQLFRYL